MYGWTHQVGLLGLLGLGAGQQEVHGAPVLCEQGGLGRVLARFHHC